MWRNSNGHPHIARQGKGNGAGRIALRWGDIQGFTLIEMMLALGLAAFLLALAYSTYFGVNRAVTIASEEQDVLETGRIFMELLKRDLRGVVTSQKYPFKADIVSLGNETASTVAFVTSSSQSRNALGLSKVGYELFKTREGDKVLVRLEGSDLRGDVRKTGNAFEVSRIVMGFELSFFDGTAWVDTWGENAEGKVPKQVKATIYLKDSKGSTKTFVATESLTGGS